MQPGVSDSGAKAARARRVSGSGVPLPPLMSAERQRAMAYADSGLGATWWGG